MKTGQHHKPDAAGEGGEVEDDKVMVGVTLPHVQASDGQDARQAGYGEQQAKRDVPGMTVRNAQVRATALGRNNHAWTVPAD